MDLGVIHAFKRTGWALIPGVLWIGHGRLECNPLERIERLILEISKLIVSDMDYPRYTKSTPLSGKQAERVMKAIRTGKAIENSASRRVVREILAERKRRQTEADASTNGSVQQN